MKASHQRFIDEYLVDLDGARAAKAAGYLGSTSAHSTEAACRLQGSPGGTPGGPGGASGPYGGRCP